MSNLSRAAGVGLLFVLAGHPAAAPTAGALDSLARYADGLEAFGCTGQVVVAEGDSILLERAIGMANGGMQPVTNATAFAAGSITKSLTAALTLQLAAQGRFGLDDPLSRLLSGVPRDKAAITPRQLLSHLAGLPEDAEGVFEMDPRDTVIAKTLAVPLAREPGPRFGYSNAGFQLLAAIAERATGVPFARLVDSLLLAPAGMRASGTGADYAQHRVDFAVGRNEWQGLGSLADWRQPWAGTGAGDLATTAHDLWRWGRAFQGAGPLPAAAIDTLTTRRVAVSPGLAYGFGLWLIQREDGRDLVSIGGDVPGYHSALWVEREAPWRIVAITSAGERWGRRLAVAATQRALWRIVGSQATELPPEPAHWEPGALAKLSGEWMLAPTGRLALVRDGAGLRMQLAGAEAMALVAGPDSSGARALVEGRAGDLVRAAAAIDDSALARVLLPAERRWEPGLRRFVRLAIVRKGTLQGATIDGTVALPWLRHGLRTYVTLQFKGGTADISFAWLEGALLDVSAGEGRPAPVILPVSPLAEGGLGAWDVLDGTFVRIQPFTIRGRPALRLTGHGATFVARRK